MWFSKRSSEERRRTPVAVLALIVSLSSLTGCGLSSMPPVHTASLRPAPASVLVMRRVSTPLYIVLDPRRVPDSYVVPQDVMKAITIHEVRAFVSQHLVHTMRNFFENVYVVGPEDRIDSGHVMWVAIDSFGSGADAAYYTSGVMGARFYGSMTWSVAIRPSGGDDFIFSHSDTATGDFAGVHVSHSGPVFESTYRVALERLVSNLVEANVPRQLMQLEDASGGATASML